MSQKITFGLFFALILHVLPAWAINPDDLLRVEEAFKLSHRVVAPHRIELRWQIADGYYLYRNKLKFTPQDADVVLGMPDLPAGKMKHDPNFGDVVVYYHDLPVTLPVTSAPAATFKLKVGYQGCADVGVCYPPQQQTLTIKLAQPLPAALATSSSGNDPVASLLKPNGSGLNLFADALLPPDQAFQLMVESNDAQTVQLRWQIAEGYYLYRDKIALTVMSPDTVRVDTLQLPEGDWEQDETFGRVEVYYQSVLAQALLQRANADAQTLTLNVAYQGCAVRGVCYQPMNKTVTLALPALAEAALVEDFQGSEQDRVVALLKHDGLLWIWASFFGFGLLLAFTPCVFPMLPILSGLIVGKRETVSMRRGLLLSLSYVLASALMYTVFGVLAALFGANLQALFQQTWILVLFSGLFVALALSMFGFYHLELPKVWQAKLHDVSEQHRDGSYWGAAIMGALSALIVGPCVAAPLAGALIYIGQTGDAWLGGSALFMMGLGMGAPLVLVGASAGKLLPKAGHWLNATKAVFGVLMLAMAVWMLDRILPGQVTLLLWALLLIIPAIYLNALEPLAAGASGWQRLWKGVGVVMLGYGVMLLIGVSLGNQNPLKPLAGLNVQGQAFKEAPVMPMTVVTSMPQLQTVLAESQAKGQLVMLDFYADWCVSCKELEAFTFTDPAVRRQLQAMRVVKADVTENTPEQQALLKQFDLFGPPAILFFQQGQELARYRVIGYQDAGQFLTTLTQVKQSCDVRSC
ncbi:MAG: protein-disulfide reductase DsbD [Methylococcales bacterium]|nr:protein-disulfide reductase DsbD [Methylococcales bacterium]